MTRDPVILWRAHQLAQQDLQRIETTAKMRIFSKGLEAINVPLGGLGEAALETAVVIMWLATVLDT